jgi:hypothetical protein
MGTAIGLAPPFVVSGLTPRQTSPVAPVEDLSIDVVESAPPPPLAPSARPSPPARSAPPALQDQDEVRDLDTRKLALFAGGVSAFVLTVVVLATLGSASRRDVPAPPAASSAAEASGSSPSSPPPPRIVPATSAPPAHASDFGMGRYLELIANAPIAEVRIGARVIDVGIAAHKVSIELEPEETEGDLSIVAKSTDGRTANANLSHDERAATLTFGPALRAPRR